MADTTMNEKPTAPRPWRWKGGRVEATKRYREENREAINARKRELYAANPEHSRAHSKAYRKRHPDRVLGYNRRWGKPYREQVRLEMMTAYGASCSCCGERQQAFLQLDHIYNDGNAERRREKCSGYVFFARLKKRGWPKDRYQLLCANCNVGKRMNGGVCPHLQA